MRRVSLLDACNERVNRLQRPVGLAPGIRGGLIGWDRRLLILGPCRTGRKFVDEDLPAGQFVLE